MTKATTSEAKRVSGKSAMVGAFTKERTVRRSSEEGAEAYHMLASSHSSIGTSPSEPTPPDDQVHRHWRKSHLHSTFGVRLRHGVCSTKDSQHEEAFVVGWRLRKK